MKRETEEQIDIGVLLRHAEMGAVPPPAGSESTDFAGFGDRLLYRLEAIRRRRHRMAYAVAAGTVVLALAAAIPLVSRERRSARVVRHEAPAAPTPAAPKVADLRRQIAELNREAAMQEQIAQRLLTIEAAGRTHRAVGVLPDAQASIERQRYRAAMQLVREGDDLWQSRREARAAAEAYRRVITLFPQTYWAGVARERLSRIGGAEPTALPDAHKPAA